MSENDKQSQISNKLILNKEQQRNKTTPHQLEHTPIVNLYISNKKGHMRF